MSFSKFYSTAKKRGKGLCDNCNTEQPNCGPWRGDDGVYKESVCGTCKLKEFFSSNSRVESLTTDIRNALSQVGKE